MKITRLNYYQVVVPLAQNGFASVADPDARELFKEIHSDLAHDTNDFSDYSRVDADKEVKELVALYIQKLNKYLNKGKIGPVSRAAAGKKVASTNRAKTATKKTDAYIDRELQLKTKVAKAKLLLLQSANK